MNMKLKYLSLLLVAGLLPFGAYAEDVNADKEAEYQAWMAQYASLFLPIGH